LVDSRKSAQDSSSYCFAKSLFISNFIAP